MTRVTNPSDAPIGAPVAPNGKSILIAEDDPFISRMYQTKLKAAGYKVVLKNNGRDAYDAIEAEKPDLLLLDIGMPELTGLEVLQQLSNDGFDFGACPAWVLTNSSSAEHRQMAESLGADYIIKAELTPREVLDRINTKLGIKTPGA